MKKVLYALYGIIFTIIVFCAVINETSVVFKTSAEQYSICLATFVFLIVMTTMLLQHGDIKNKLENKWSVILIICIGVALRYGYYILVHPVPVSDFLQPFLFAEHLKEIGQYEGYSVFRSELDDFQIYYSLYPAWGMYMQYIRILYNLFGFCPGIVVTINILLYIVSSVFVVKVCSSQLGRKVALGSLVLFSMPPQMVIWSSVTTPDHFAVCFLIIFIYFWGKLENCNNKKSIIVYCILMTVSISAMNLFKPVKFLFIIAIIVTEVLRLLISEMNIKKIMRQLRLYIGVIIIFIVSNVLLQSMNEYLLEETIHTDVQEAVAYYLLWGYTVDENGNWNANEAGKYMDVVNKQYDFMPDNLRILQEIAIDNIKSNIKLLPRIWKQKFNLLFYSDTWPTLWTLREPYTGIGEWVAQQRSLIEMFMSVLNIVTVLLMPLALKRKSSFVNLCSLGWLGYILYLVITGVQTRYRYIILIIQFILTIVGINEVCRFVNKLPIKGKQKAWRKNNN